MLLQLFKTISLQSAVGTVLILVLLLLKSVTRRIFGSRWQYYIWLCVLVVLILPPITVWSPQETTVPASSLHQTESAKINETPGVLPYNETKVVENTPFEYRNVEFIHGLQISQYNLVISVWLAGAAVFFFKYIISYLLFLRTIRKHSKPLSCPMLDIVKKEKDIRSNIRVRVTQCINAPLISGFLKPTLLLPDAGISDKSLRHVLLHELTHHKRYDFWYKWFSVIVNAIHWFNPVIYIAVQQINEECEISCDSAVVKDMNMDERKGYMSTILNMMAQNKASPLISAMSGSKGQIKRRFKMISKEKRLNRFMSAVAFITAVVIFITTLFAGNVLAAGTQDGLEIWSKNEIYYRDGIKFSVNVSEKSVPGWVFEDVAGKDGKIDVTLKRVQSRDVKGEVFDCAILELKGEKGTTRLSDVFDVSYRETSSIFNSGVVRRIPELLHEAYTCGYSFDEEFRKSVVASLVTRNSGKRKKVDVDFAFGENETLSAVYMDFSGYGFCEFSLMASEIDTVEHSEEGKYKPVKAYSGSIEFIGNFEKDYVLWAKNCTKPYYFTYFEKDFVNKKVAGIDIAVDSARTHEITLKTSVTNPKVSSYSIFLYNKEEQLIHIRAYGSNFPEGYLTGNLTLKASKDHKRNPPELPILKGETCRVDIVLFDKERNVIYRQREHIKIP